MNRHWLPSIVRVVSAAIALIVLTAVPAAAQTEIVLHTKNASTLMGDWQLVADSTAASGARMWNPDRGAAKLNTPAAAPLDYFELTFTAEAGRPYRLWMRGRAENNHWANDSVFVQFNGSLNASGGAMYRIGTTSAAMMSVEGCSGCGLSNWGWEDNGWESLGPLVYFATTGPQTIRVQKREDGISIDQIVLSASKFLTSAPGATKNCSTILPASDSTSTSTSTTTTTSPTTTSTTSSTEIVIAAASSATLRGDWQMVSDSTAANGVRLWNPDRGAAKLSAAAASPTDYFDVTFNAEAGRAYRLWIRGQAQNNAWTNDSVFVQFSGSVNGSGSAVWRTGTTSAMTVSIEACSGCGLSGWGWEDNGYGTMGELVYFATTGPQTLRVQRREDGISIDQIVLSASKYLTASPGATKNDTTLLIGSTSTSPTSTTSTTSSTTTTSTTSATTTTTSGAVKLRVLEWNLHHGVGTDGVYDIERIATWMASFKPDVILLNEVEKNTWWGYEDQPARYKAMLEQRTGRRWYSHFSQEYGAWDANGKGHQILSVYPFESTSHAIITQSAGLNGAGAVSQAGIIVNGRTINFILSHLDPHDRDMRLVQARDVIRFASGFAENRILGGDMNAWPDQTSIAEFNKTYFDSWSVAAANGTAKGIWDITPFGATKKGRIDYIFYSRNAPNLVVLESWTPDTRNAQGHMPSDHRPVLTTFEVR